jgi:membrane dipeptidase
LRDPKNDPNQEEHSRELHKQATIVDGTQASNFTDAYFSVVKDAGVTVSIPTVAHIENLSESIKLVADWYFKLRRNQTVAIQATTMDDVKRAKDEGKVAYVFTFQNTHPLETKIELLDVFHKLGVRMIQITYNEKNLVGDGCGERTNSGLSDFGLKLIERMNDLDMVVDLSHVGDRTTDEATEAGKLVVFSHSNARALCKNVRNKTDEQIKAIAEKDGIIGVAAFPSFVKWTKMEKDELPTLEDYLDHIDYIVNLVGPEHVGLGFDFVENVIQEEQTKGLLTRPDIWGLPTSRGIYEYAKGIGKISEVINVTRGLIARGYSDNDTINILGETGSEYSRNH